MHHPALDIPRPQDPCPPADDPEAILLWLYRRHVEQGRIVRSFEQSDPFWRRIEQKRRYRRRLAVSLRDHPEREERVRRMATLLGLDLTGLAVEEQIAAVVDAFVPMRYHISAELEALGEIERAAEVLVMTY